MMCDCECCKRRREESNLLVGAGFWGRTAVNLTKKNEKLVELLAECLPHLNFTKTSIDQLKKIRVKLDEMGYKL